MQTHSENPVLDTKLERIGNILRLTGWLSFGIELALAAASILILIFVVGGRNFNQDVAPVSPVPGARVIDTAPNTPGINIGIFWAIAGILALLIGIFLAFRQVRFAKRMRNSDTHYHPKKAEILQVLRWGVIVGLIGMLLSILGGGATLGVLLSKSIAQPQGVAIYDPSRIIRSLDIFVAMANMNGIAAHFIGTTVNLVLFNWLHRQ